MRITNTATGGVIVNGTLKTANTGGLYGIGSAIPSGTLTLSDNSTIDYYATADQAISSAPNYYNITFSGAGTKTPQNATSVHTNGTVRITGNPTVDFTNWNLGSTGLNDTNFIMDGGKFIVGTGDTQPRPGGTYTITGGALEFKGNSVTDIRVTPDYYDVIISGENKKPGAKGFTIKNILSVTSTGKLTIQEVLDNETPYVVTAKKGIQVANGGEVIFQNNAQLMQDAGAVNSGSVQAERKTSMKKMDYTYWSAPVTGQILKNTGATANTENSTGGFSPGTPNSRIFRYNEPNDYFVATTDNDFIPGKGYAIRGKNGYGTTKTPDTFSFTGTPNNGDAITVTVQRSPDTTSGANTYQHGYNLIGNPYPSGLNFYNFFDQNQTKITGKAWFWSNAYDTLYQTGSVNYLVNNYAVLTLLGGSPPTYGDVEGPTGYTPTENIKLGQGFIIQVRPELTSTQPVLTFANTMRTTGAGAFFNNFKNQPESKNRYWVKFVSPDNVVNTILLGYVAQATNDYDMDYDAELFTVGDDSFYSLLGTRKMQIQAKGEFVQDSKIDIGTKQNKDGNYTIKIEQPEGVFANGQAIYLHDKLNGTYTNLLEQNYTFSAIKGATENRFEIVYKSGAVLATGGNTKESLQVYRNGENFIVKSANKKIDEVEVYDASGRLFQKLKGNTTEFVINATTLSSGMYILKIKRNNETISKKIMK